MSPLVRMRDDDDSETPRIRNYAAPAVEWPFDLYFTIQGCFLTSTRGRRLSESYWRSCETHKTFIEPNEDKSKNIPW